MSGIAGLCYPQPHPDAARRCAAVLDAMAHRGPDGRGAWAEGRAALGHLMLHVTPESLVERQPYTDAGGAVITAQARIDNREALAAQLGLPLAVETSDAQLILAAYRRWGRDCAAHLYGDFAFGIWDPAEQSFLCARDHMGVVPFYYTHVPGVLLAFASEAGSLVRLPEAPRALNEVRIADMLLNLISEQEGTIYAGVLRLPPAHTLWGNAHGIERRRYWQAEPQTLRETTPEAQIEAFYDHFAEAVRARCRSAFPVGSQLSGGLDSTFVSCVARDHLVEAGRGPLHTFSMIFDHSPESDERDLIAYTLKQPGFAPHLLPMDDISPIDSLDEEYEHLEVLSQGAHHYQWACFKAARAAGVRVLLDGLDGDTIVGDGYLRFRELAHAGDWPTFWQEAEAAVALRRDMRQFQGHEQVFTSLNGIFRAFGMDELNDLARRGRYLRLGQRLLGLRGSVHMGPVLEMLLRRRVRDLRRGVRRHSAVVHDTAILNPDFTTRLGASERIGALADEWMNDATEAGRQQSMLNRNPYTAALEPIGYAECANGLVVAHPFLDVRLATYCLSLPVETKFRGGWNRWIMREAMRRTAPAEVARRVGKANAEQSIVRGAMRLAARMEEMVEAVRTESAYINEQELDRLHAQGASIEGLEFDRLLKAYSVVRLIQKARGILAKSALQPEAVSVD